MSRTVGLVGARGYTGRELLALIASHAGLELAFVCSRGLAGQRVADRVPAYTGDLRYELPDAQALAARRVDAMVLALPNGESNAFVAALARYAPQTVIVDLSADHRFDDDWHYGLPELTREHRAGKRRISNPGCYATAMQLAIAPLRARLRAPPVCFGVSGYSGAGAAPTERNDRALLADNLMPYSLADHLHQREVAHRIGMPVEFMPHVAPHFRGITITANLHLDRAMTREEVIACYRQRYLDEPLVRITDAAPWVSRVAGKHHVEIGGFAVADGGRRVIVVAVLDNLLKGAATQALQNLSLALGFAELEGIPLQQAQLA